MNPRCSKLFTVFALAALSGCASSGVGGNAAAVAPPPGQPPANVYIAAAPAAGPPPTLPGFLGITECKQHTAQSFGALSSFVHRLFPMLSTAFPGAEGPPPIQPLSSPANLESPSPAVAAAAKIKQEEDQAQQKILALNYLATVGCGGCYPEVEAAFLAAMDDCTEDVRYAAVKAIKEAAGQPCTFCKSGSCCSPDVRRKLTELSEDHGDDCCLTEPSARVRRLARIALTYCGNQPLEPTPDIEGPVPTDQWDVVPALAGAREFNAVQATDTTAAALAKVADGTVSAPEDAHVDQSTRQDSADVDELVTKWYRTVDPTLTIEKKKELLQTYLARHFREEAEKSALLQAANQEYVFRERLKTAFALKQQLHVVPSSGSADLQRCDTIIPTSHTSRGLGQITNAWHEQPEEKLVNWEQIELDIREESREHDAAMMNEVWSLVNDRQPNPGIKIDRARLRARTSGLVDLKEVPNTRLRKVLATTAVGSCSPVIITERKIFIVRILDRRDNQQRSSKVLD
jgi:hypothetical protein